MSQNNDPKQQKPWDKQFAADHDELSRTANRKRSSHNSLITGILVLVIIALASVPVWYFVSNMNSFNHPQGSAPVSVSASKKKSASSKTSVKTKDQKNSTKTAKAAVSASSVTESASASSTSSESASAASSSSSSDGDEKYVTVEAGQGLYRVAANNGISLQQLLTLNGLSSGAQVAPGQQLRVK